ncbi:MAG: radical SAM protein, partial [Defluviitaleaceae bacterium]|nr:radical SAM protein [Defluviitaleaceae bacterium]
MENLNDYRYMISARNDELATGGKRPTFFIRTYGCQMNERDSEKMAGLLAQLGFVATETQDVADLILYNTCCVRESAEDKIFGHLSYLKPLKADNPEKIIAVGGCMPQQKDMSEILKTKHKYVNLVFGTTNRHRLPEFLWRVINGERIVDISEGVDLEIENVPVTTRQFSHKAGVNIMYGCDNFCSYCIVPYVRGREKSRPAADIIEEVRALVADGVKEIMLLGQNVNSYSPKKEITQDNSNSTQCTIPKSGVKGTASPCRGIGDSVPKVLNLLNHEITSFPQLLHEINKIDGLERVRFMTSHPKDFSDELIAAVRDLGKVCKSVHLPLQA